MLGASASLKQGVASNSRQTTLSAVWQVAWIIGSLRCQARTALRRAFNRTFSSPTLALHDNLTSYSRIPFRCRASALDQIPEQVRRHRQLGEGQAAGRDFLDRVADARRFGVSREPAPGGLLTGLAGCQHIRGQFPFRGCDLVNGVIDGETFEIIVCRQVLATIPAPAHCREVDLRRVMVLKRGVFRSVVDLQVAINRFVAETNADPKHFVWTADPKRVLAAVKRGKQTLKSLH